MAKKTEMTARRRYSPTTIMVGIALSMLLLPGALFWGAFLWVKIGGVRLWTPEDQERKLAGFSAAISDPAAYWGKRSVSVPVAHGSFDTLIVNSFPDLLPSGSYVVIGLREGRIASYCIDAASRDKFAINGRVFRWAFHLLRGGRSDDDLTSIAKQVTQQDIDDLRALAQLLHDPTVYSEISKRSEIGTWGWFIQDFDSCTRAIAERKRKITANTSAEPLNRKE